MKNFTIFLVAILTTMFSFAQTDVKADKMKKHSGETLDVNVIKVGENTKYQ